MKSFTLFVGILFLLPAGNADAGRCGGIFRSRGEGPGPMFRGRGGDGPIPFTFGGDGPHPLAVGSSIPYPRPTQQETGRRVSLIFENRTYSDFLVEVSLQHSDGIYRLYARHLLNAGSGQTTGKEPYYLTDSLLFRVYSRGYPSSPWYFRYSNPKTIHGPGGVFNVQTGDILYPATSEALRDVPKDGKSTEKSILEHCQGNKNLKNFTKLLEMSDIGELLATHGPFTVFAINDKAFDGMPKSFFSEMKDKEKRVKFLSYHIMSGSHAVADIERYKSIHTWGGQVFVHPGKGLRTEGHAVAPYVTRDERCGNGTIHILGGPLTPPKK